MKAQEIRDLMKAQPFQPFIVNLPSGKAVPVIHHDFAFMSPDGRTLWVYQKDFSLEIVDVMLIQSLSFGIPQTASEPAGNGG